ncbi:MAG: hypothetical protein Q4D38_01740 [Planctomycetia bacterium]|nr:hypothetical protein [Planctomycetia bacterium]
MRKRTKSLAISSKSCKIGDGGIMRGRVPIMLYDTARLNFYLESAAGATPHGSRSSKFRMES